MANQQFNVKLGFQAETSQAKKAIEDLGKSLRQIQVQPQSVFDDRALRKASQAAQDLEKHLFRATNVNTNKLDLNKFSQSLTNADQNLQSLCNDLRLAGKDGEKAFLNLIKNINKADSSTLNLGSKMEHMLKTLKNTARWEMSSNIVHGVESALSNAYGYAQDLNKSLNDIRIVTGRNIDQMAQFAESANRAAKALSTTTTDYTNASLIYFQQGLSNKEVEERTNVTIKMANAAGESAQTISDQMTAVWNNFDNGTKSLEYYADVMTALGAATASSTSEISEGLNKFAAIAETVGLSYEYATAALATVTSQTRESADVVGNAYKTLFARIQGLQQGDTLDDGTTLNKYSQALKNVGIDIKDVNGDMKDMNTILDEMGAKWVTLEKDQQLALAQTVAGVRQYNQLVSLMDNWQVFQKNLTTAYASEGTLNEQAEIYAESWEAASKRVEAAAEGIYKSLLNDEFFIDITNIFGGFISGIEDVIQGIGGLKNILLIVGSIFLKQYAKEIPGVLVNLKNNFEVITGKAEKNKTALLKKAAEEIGAVDISKIKSKETQGELAAQQKVSEMNYQLAESKKFMSKAQIEFYETQIKNVTAYGEEAAAIGKEIEALEKLSKSKRNALLEDSKGDKATGRANRFIDNKIKAIKAEKLAPLKEQEQEKQQEIQAIQQKIHKTKQTTEIQRAEIAGEQEEIEKWQKQIDKLNKEEREYQQRSEERKAKKTLLESQKKAMESALMERGLTKRDLADKQLLQRDFEEKGITKEELEEYVKTRNQLTGIKSAITREENAAEKRKAQLAEKREELWNKKYSAESKKSSAQHDLMDFEFELLYQQRDLKKKEKELSDIQQQHKTTADEINVWRNKKEQTYSNDQRAATYDEWHKQMSEHARLDNIRTRVESQTAKWDKNLGLADNSLDKQKEKMVSFLKTLEEGGTLTEKEFVDLSNQINSFDGSIQELIDKFRAMQAEENSPFKRLEEDIAAADVQVEALTEDLRAMGYSNEELSAETDRTKQIFASEDSRQGTLERISNQNAEIPEEFMGVSEVMGVMAANAMELWGAISMLQGIGDIWRDEDLTTGEKLLQTISAMIPVATMFSTVLNETNKKQLIAAGNSILHIAGLTGETAATTGATVATGLFSKALVALNASFGPLGVVIGVFVAALAAVALVVWGVVEAFQFLKNSTPEAQLKAAKEQAKELNKTLEETTNAANELKNAFNEYDSAQKALEDCTKNTQEWYKALTDVNNQVLSLLQTYPELATMTNTAGEKAIRKGQEGQTEIADWAKEEILAKSNKSVQDVQIATTRSTQKARALETDLLVKDAEELISQAAANSSMMVSGDVADYLAKNATKIMSSEDLSKDLPTLFENIGYNGDVDTWVDAISEITPELNKLSAQIEANNAVTKTENELLARQILAQDKNIANSENFDAAAKITGASLESKIEAEYAKMENEDKWDQKGISKATGVNQDARDIFEEYAKAAGITNYDLTDTTGRDKNRNFVYTDSSGQEVTVSLENMKRVVAASRVSAEVAENAQDFIAALSNKTTAEVAAMTAATTQNVEDLTVGQAAGNFDIESFAKGLTDSDLTAMGYESAEAYLKAYNEVVSKAEGALIDVIDDYSISVQEQLNQMKQDGVLADLTIGQVDAFSSYLQEALFNGGQEALDNLSTIFSSIDPEQQGDFIETLGTIDWPNTSIHDLSEALRIAGIDTSNFAADDLQNLIDSMRDATEAAQAGITKFATLNEIIKDLKTGDVVEKEDYDKFEEYGIEADNYFTLMADGTYKLIADAKEFYNVVKSNMVATLKAGVDSNLEKSKVIGSAAATAQSSYSWDAMRGRIGYIEPNQEKQLEVLETLGGDIEQIQMWRDALGHGVDVTKEINEALNEAIITAGGDEEAIKKINEAQREHSQTLHESISSYLTASSTLDELKMHASQLETESGVIVDGSTEYAGQEITAPTSEAYQQALISLASQYESCTAQINAYREAITSGNEETIKAAQSTLELSIRAGELADKYDLDADALEVQAKYLKKSAANAELSEKQLIELAAANQRMNKGISTLHKNWKDWNKTLKKADKTSMDYAKTVADMTDALVEITGALDDSMIPFDFFDESTEAGAEHLKWMGKAAEGDVKSINLLGNAVGALTVKSLEMNDEIASLAIKDKLFDTSDFDSASDAFEGYRNEILEGVTALQDAIRNGTLEAGENVTELMDGNGKTWVDSLNQMAIATGMSVDEMNSLLNQLGVQTEVTTTDVKQQMKVPMYVEKVEPITVTDSYTDEDGSVRNTSRTEWAHYTVPMGTKDVEGYTQVAQIKASDNDSVDSKPKVTWTGTSGSASGGGVSPSSTANKGSGSSSKKKADTVKKSDVVTRYKQIDDKLDDVTNSMDDASKAADRLWGAARLNQMKKVNNLLAQEISLTRKKKEEAEDYLEIDKQDLMDLAEESGLTFTFDSSGNISNYDEQMTKLYEELDNAITEANKDGNADDDEQDEIDEIQDRVDALTDAIDQYDETRELIEDLDDELQDKINTWQDNNYDMLNYELEIKVSVEDSKLELIDYYVNKIQDDIYKTAEAFGYMKDSVQSYSTSLAAQEEYAKKLEEDYRAGKISMAAYKEGLQETQSATIENLEALQEQKEAMQDYYGTVMDLALEEIAIYTDEMEQLNSVMDHYSNILGIVGKQEDYATKKKVLNAKASNLRNEMQVQKNLYEESAAEAEKWYAKMNAATEGTNEYETYKKNWMAAQEAANEAQDAMLSKTEEWAEAMKEVIEAELGELAQTMEESLTGGTSFDELLTSMERRSSLQEEYLTTTNKIYETNKLMRQAQQEIDKSTNAIAKKKLQSFINQTDALQDQTRLSQYELDIQKAKYDLLLAEIALEEARNAKSTVKLSRDSEGNFSYVYTADSDAVSSAQQELEDKQNALYNLGLEGANNYSQKYAELMQEAQDAITELTTMWMNGEIATEEEYQRRKAEIQDYYYNKLKDYSELYQIALTTDTNVIKDAWSTDFSSMIYKTDEWKIAVDNYFTGAAKSMSEWASVCSTVLADSGLDKIDDQLDTIATRSEELKTKLIGEDGESGVVGAMMDEVEAAGKLSEAYIKIQNEIDKLIAKYENLLKKVNEDYTNPADITTTTTTTDTTDNDDDDDTTTTTTTATTDTKTIKVGGKINAKDAKIYDYAGDKSGERQYFRSDPIYKVLAQDGDWIKVRHHKLSSGVTGWFKKGDVTALNTGGYTGTWEGSYGKLAFLHQKELVLNAQDTENFLTSMNVLERILKVIDIQALNSSLGAGISAPSMNHSGNEVLEQKVSIEAHFPNVNNHTEIEEAFNNLINTASQYANRKS